MCLQAANKAKDKKWFAVRQTIFLKSPRKCFFHASLLILSISWLLPNHSYPLSSILQDLSAFFAASIALLSIPRLKISTEAAIVLATSSIPLLQLALGIIKLPGDALNASLFMILLCISIAIGNNLKQKKNEIKKIQETISIYIITSSLICIYIQIRQWLHIPGNIYIVDLPPNGRPFANFAQPNNLATFLCMGLLSNWLLFKNGKISYNITIFFALIILFGIALTQSRTPWITLPILFSLLAFSGKKRTATLFALYYIAASLLIPPISKILLLETENILSRAIQSQRFLIWKPLIDMAFHAPPLGYGWNQIPLVQLAYSEKIKTGFVFDYSHNLFLDIIIYNGKLVGATLIALMSFAYLQRIRQNEEGTNTYPLLCITTIAIHCQLEFPHAYAYFLVPFGLFWGISSNSRNILLIPQPIPAVLAAIIAALVVKASIEYTEVEQNFLTLRMQHAKITSVQPKAMSSGIFFSELKTYYAFINSPEKTQLGRFEIEKAEFISHRFPFKYTMEKYIRILKENNLKGEAEIQEQKLINISPGGG